MESTARKSGSTSANTRAASRLSGRKRRRGTSHKRSMILITIVLLVLMTVLGVHSISIIERSRMLQQQEEELLVQIRYQERRAAEIEEFEAFAHTDEHVRIMAEEVLGLVEPDVIIFRPID